MVIKSAPLSGAAAGALLACTAGVAEAQNPRNSPPSTLEQKIENLTAAVDALNNKLEAETRARQALEAELASAKAEAAASRTDAQAAREQVTAHVDRVPEAAGPTPKPGAPDSAGIHFKGVTITPGGFLAAEGIYRSKNQASDISSSFSRIPFANSPLAHTNELRLTARQSRFSALVQGDFSPTTHAAFYGEFDLQGGAQTANSIESNSYNPRLRHMYGTLDWDGPGLHLLAGQTWSLVTLNGKGITPRNEMPPGLIDGQYLPGFTWARQPQVRLVKDWGKTVWAAISLENPQTTFAAPATGISTTASGITAVTTVGAISGFDAGNMLSLNHTPDLVAKLAYEPEIGNGRPLHLEIFGLLRAFETRVTASPGNSLGLPPGTFDTNADGYGIGGSITGSVLSGHVDLQASVIGGEGIGRYGSAQLPDITLRPDGTAEAIPEIMYLLGATWHVTPSLDIYLFGGEERQRRRYFDNAAGHFGFGNPAATFTEASCTTEGGVCAPNLQSVSQITVGFWQKLYTGPVGQIRFGLQYSHTDLDGFSGVEGFEPETSDDMVFISFRYYLPS